MNIYSIISLDGQKIRVKIENRMPFLSGPVVFPAGLRYDEEQKKQKKNRQKEISAK